MSDRVLLKLALLPFVLAANVFVYPATASADSTSASMSANQAAPVAEPNAILDARFPPEGLSLTAMPGLTQITSNEGKVDFGRVSLLKTPTLTQTFRLKNVTDKPLTLDRLQTSCHCTSAVWEIKDSKMRLSAEAAPLTLLPGKSIAVNVRLNLTQMAAGQVVKSVMVFLKGQTQPAALVTLVVDVQPVVSFWPHKIDFGQVSMGAPRTVTLTADFDPALVKNGKPPVLVSSDPNIKIVAANTSLQEGTVRQIYTLTLSPLVAETVSGSLSFASAGTVESDTAARAALSNVSVPVQGEVIGSVAAEPSALALGPVPGKRSTEGRITLTGQTEQTLAGATVVSDSPYLVARLENAAPGGTGTAAGTQAAVGESMSNGMGGFQAAANSQTMSVTVKPNAPLGELQAQVRVTLANGQSLLVPVTAYVIAPNAL